MLDITLGQGQFGVVYKAHLVKCIGLNENLTQDVAVKILKGTYKCVVLAQGQEFNSFFS